MRIISGIKKGYRIMAPRNLPIRPTTDRSKESLFNILAHRYDFEECEVLDLFSGGGSITLEFASRGANTIVSVDKHPGCVAFVKSEAEKLEFPQIEVVMSDCQRFVDRTTKTFDLVFCDPPYAFKPPAYEALVLGIIMGGKLKEGGLMAMEHHSIYKFNHLPGHLETRAHGQNLMSFYVNLDEVVEQKK